ncbi:MULTISPECIES: hypothetical protein [Bacillus cereus group]|uniref:hypothetical protein n=1 Tax=Bacillus cereus group TaxID=86661 RepID=UPI0001A1C5A6|nr:MULTISPECIES: hypothetical protein [Bacillus cereus group]EEM68419.1 hypothetical protein bthur0009_55310 [Bacillus thuringiensis serovar andalousiensis BGSC 4AW1]MEB9631827.1 hypothetical protein [Bacillus anthracis]
MSPEKQSRAKITGDLIDWNEFISYGLNGPSNPVNQRQLERLKNLQENPETKTFLENK